MRLVMNSYTPNGDENVSTIMNIKDNTLFIYDYIVPPVGNHDSDPNSVTSEEFLENIRNLSGSDLEVRINSKGGELSYSLSIYNTLMEHDGKVTTIVDGYAYSCASWILLAGSEREISPGGIVMTHNPMINAVINSETAIEKIMPQWRASRDSIAGIISTRTGKSIEDVHNLMDAQTFMTADEAIKNGFCTKKRTSKAFLPSGVGNYLPPEIRNAIPESNDFDYADLMTQSAFFRSKKLINTLLTK